MAREFQVIVWGATGFTGKLVAAHLLHRFGTDRLRWAIGGRSEEKLAAVREELGAPELPLVIGDSHSVDDMQALAERTEAIATTVGPYSRYGNELVAACARYGTHYCDLAGEVPWMRRMIDAHHTTARLSGAGAGEQLRL